MNKAILIVIVIVIVGGISAYAVSPYFTESTIDEGLPIGAIIPTKNSDTMMEEDMMGDTMMDEKMRRTPITYTGSFVGVGDGIHDAQGKAYTISLDDGTNVLRLENFQSTNGPDLYVYLATDDKASDFINLGELKANQGNQNYEIPHNSDLTKYNNVLIWCKTFGVLFGSAEILPQQ